MPRDGKSCGVITDHLRYDDGVLRIAITGSPLSLAISGEIDEDTCPALARKLAQLTGPADIHLHLGGVTYCNLAGMRVIIGLAGASRGSYRRRVILHEVPPELKTVLAILGWDSTPGLLMDDGPAGRRSAGNRWVP